jgi:hypothetical protein
MRKLKVWTMYGSGCGKENTTEQLKSHGFQLQLHVKNKLVCVFDFGVSRIIEMQRTKWSRHFFKKFFQ